MRINRFIASCSSLSRRSADQAIVDGRVTVNGHIATLAISVRSTDRVTLDGHELHPPAIQQTIMLYKPVGYVVSRDGQGSKTIYDLLPQEFKNLIPIGRLDKNSSGLLLLTKDGQLAHRLSHPSFNKTKVYEIELSSPLQPLHKQLINDQGVVLEDGISRLTLEPISHLDNLRWRIVMHEGRNRQIRRTFAALGYTVIKLHRTHFGTYVLPKNLKPGTYINA